MAGNNLILKNSSGETLVAFILAPGASIAKRWRGCRGYRARYNDGNGDSSAHTRIYAWNGTAWVQRGTDIDGEAAGHTCLLGYPQLSD